VERALRGGGLRYIDRLVRADGEWKIASRRVDADVIDGFHGVAWQWTARQPPVTG